MMDQYLWQRSQDGAGMAAGNTSTSTGERNGHGNMNGVILDAHGHTHAVSNGVEWPSDFGYVNGSSSTQEHHSMQQGISQNIYSQNWSATPYDAYGGYNGVMPSNITPAALLAQSAQNHPVTNRNHGQAEAPTTIDPTLMMTMQPSYGQYSTYQHSSMPPMGRISSYENYPASSLSAVIEFHDNLDTPTTSSTSLPGTANGMNAGINLSNSSQSKNASAMAIESSSMPLIVQVKDLLTPQRLDTDPRGTCKGFIDLIIPEGSNEPISVDTDTRAEILSRLRDHAPEGFFMALVKDIDMLVVLKEWGKNAIKKETFAVTLTGWLQVVDRLPMTYKALSESGLGKVVQYIAEHPPTTAIKDTAARITAGWKKLLPATQAPVKTEPESKPRISAAEKSKKRKAEDPPTKTACSSTGPASSTSANGPATKKAAISTPAGTKAVRRDSNATAKSLSSTATTGTAITPGISSASSAKAANSDSSFFSSKPKAKLPSFRKKPGTDNSSAGDIKTEDVNIKIAQPQPQAATNDWNPFTDALKAVRKGSPAVPAIIGGGDNATGDGRKLGISSRTGKLKKTVRFREGVELEMIKFIEKAIYDDDMPGGTILHGQSWRDLDRSEGSLLKHMIAEIDWYDPPPIAMDPSIQSTNRGELSAEATAQAERENTALAAVYQGNPPDTPIEPPHLANPSNIDESSMKTMILGQKVEEELQIGRSEPQITANYYLSQLGVGTGQVDPSALGAMDAYAQQFGSAIPGGQGATPQVTELLSKIMQTMGSTGDGFGAPPAQPSITSFGQPPNGVLAQTGLLNALMAANSVFGANGQPPTAAYGANGFDNLYGDGTGYDPSQIFGGGDNSMASTLPPPLHSGMPGRDDDEDRWKKGTKGGGPGGKKGKGPWKEVPASQNTRRPLCTFFAQGRCRFGEECTFSHDTSKLPKGS